MNRNGDIIFIEDDADDREVFAGIFSELSHTNKIIFFDNGTDALEYLKRPDVVPFIIFSDINMPGMNGFELRELLFNDPTLHDKCVPYIFMTTSGDSQIVRKAYNMSIQGFFRKNTDYDKQVKTVDAILNYWKDSLTP